MIYCVLPGVANGELVESQHIQHSGQEKVYIQLKFFMETCKQLHISYSFFESEFCDLAIGTFMHQLMP